MKDKDFIDQQFDGKPFMEKDEIAFLDDTIKNIIQKQNKKFMFLEWGSGGSSLYYVNLLNDIGVDFEWHSIEHHPSWAKTVVEAVNSDNLHMHVYDYGLYTRYELRNFCMKEYVSCPKEISSSFDVIIVDGRSRRRCVEEARRLIEPDGFVFLHDADREFYKSATEKFPREKIVNRLWRGSIETL